MQFVKVSLKTGQSLFGYVTNTYGSQIQMLVLKDERLIFSSFSKSVVDNIEESRPLVKKERTLLEDYIAQSKEIEGVELNIRKLQTQMDSLHEQRGQLLQNLLEQALLQEKNESEILSVADMEKFLNGAGFKNLFLLQRHGVIVLGELEEVLFVNENRKLFPLLKKQAKEVASLLNQDEFSLETSRLTLSQFVSERTQETLSNSQEKTEEETKKEIPKGLNFGDIKNQLNEHAYQTLKKLQEKNLLRIHDDGRMDFGEFGNIPVVKEMLKNPKLLVDVLNTPFPTTPLIPIPLFNGLGGILKEIERAFHQEDK